MDINSILDKIKQNSESNENNKEDFHKKEFTTKLGAGDLGVEVLINGKKEIQEIKVADSFLKEKPSMAVELIIATVNQAIKNIEKEEEELKGANGLGGLGGLGNIDLGNLKIDDNMKNMVKNLFNNKDDKK